MFIGKAARGRRCSICMTEKAIHAEFQDNSFSGIVCLKHLWSMIEARMKNGTKDKQKESGNQPSESKTEAKAS